MTKDKILETSLVLTTGFLVIYKLSQTELFLWLAISFGLIGVFVKPLAKYIAIAWFKLADILNFFMSKIVLGSIFYFILFPVALLSRISQKDKLQLKKPKQSNWIERNHTYKSADLENIW